MPTISMTPEQAGEQITRAGYEWGTNLGEAVGPINRVISSMPGVGRPLNFRAVTPRPDESGQRGCLVGGRETGRPARRGGTRN